MEYNIKGTGVAVTPELREYVQKKFARLEKVITMVQAMRADVELVYSEHEALKYRAEFTVHAAGAAFRAEARGRTLHEAIDLAAGELAREMSRAKKKHIDLLRRGAARIKEYVRGFRDRF